MASFQQSKEDDLRSDLDNADAGWLRQENSEFQALE